MIRVVIADDHHLVRHGIQSVLAHAGDIEVVGQAEDGEGAIALVRTLQPDVLVLDMSMPRLNGIQAMEQIEKLGLPTRIVVLSMYSDEAMVRQALRLGARGYLLKRSVTEELLIAIRAANRDETYLCPAVTDYVLNEWRDGRENMEPIERLSPREREVLKLIAEGYTNKEIAERMAISVKTVEKHRANLMDKMEVTALADLVRLAIKYGLIFLDKD